MAIKVKINTSTLASHNIEGTVLYALKKTLYKNLPWKSWYLKIIVNKFYSYCAFHLIAILLGASQQCYKLGTIISIYKGKDVKRAEIIILEEVVFSQIHSDILLGQGNNIEKFKKKWKKLKNWKTHCSTDILQELS